MATLSLLRQVPCTCREVSLQVSDHTSKPLVPEADPARSCGHRSQTTQRAGGHGKAHQGGAACSSQLVENSAGPMSSFLSQAEREMSTGERWLKRHVSQLPCLDPGSNRAVNTTHGKSGRIGTPVGYLMMTVIFRCVHTIGLFTSKGSSPVRDLF